MMHLFGMLSEFKKLSISKAHLRPRDDLSASCCISFELTVQEEHNGAILEAVSLLCGKLLPKTSLDLNGPYLNPRLDKHTQQRKT